jgi:hypothetical protein
MHRRYLSPPAWFVRMWPFSNLQACPLSRCFRDTSGRPSVIVPNVPIYEYTTEFNTRKSVGVTLDLALDLSPGVTPIRMAVRE